jgi:AraC family transcriptional regulator
LADPTQRDSLIRPASRTASGARERTWEEWHQAVERAVEVMVERMADPLALDAMAHAALLSPYYFNRVFRIVTGIPPGRFLTAFRMAEAKRLLLTTSDRVTDVCFAVGFESLGTFTTRFGQLIGVAPQELRRLAQQHGGRSIIGLAATAAAANGAGRCLSGQLTTPPGQTCVTLVGLFERPVAQGFPAACDIVEHTPGTFNMGDVETGSYYPLAIGFPEAQTVLDATLLDPWRLLVGASANPVRVGPDQPTARVHLAMRAPARIDPPIVFAAPLVAAEVAHAALPLRSRVIARTA